MKCNCPSGSYGIKHSTACLVAQINILREREAKLVEQCNNVLSRVYIPEVLQRLVTFIENNPI